MALVIIKTPRVRYKLLQYDRKKSIVASGIMERNTTMGEGVAWFLAILPMTSPCTGVVGPSEQRNARIKGLGMGMSGVYQIDNQSSSQGTPASRSPNLIWSWKPNANLQNSTKSWTFNAGHLLSGTQTTLPFLGAWAPLHDAVGQPGVELGRGHRRLNNQSRAFPREPNTPLN